MAKIFWDVDTQLDFMHASGRLYVPDSEAIIPVLARLTDYAHRKGIRRSATAADVAGSIPPKVADSRDDQWRCGSSQRPCGGTTGCAGWGVTGSVFTPRSDSRIWTSSAIWDARRRSRIRISTNIEIP